MGRLITTWVWLLAEFVCLIPLILAYKRLRTTGNTSWDTRLAISVENTALNAGRYLLAIAAAIAVFAISYYGVQQQKALLIKEIEKSSASESWTNPKTQRTVILPSGWQSIAPQGQAPGEVSIASFTNGVHQIMLIYEESSNPIEVHEYARLLHQAKSKAMNQEFTQPLTVELKERTSAAFSGYRLINGKKFRVIVRVWTPDGLRLWHTIAFIDEGNDSSVVDELVSDLMRSSDVIAQ